MTILLACDVIVFLHWIWSIQPWDVVSPVRSSDGNK